MLLQYFDLHQAIIGLENQFDLFEGSLKTGFTVVIILEWCSIYQVVVWWLFKLVQFLNMPDENRNCRS